MSYFKLGPNTLAVPMSLFRKNRLRVAEAIRLSKTFEDKSYIFVKGGIEIPFNDTDVSYTFRQESYFQYLFGVKEPDCFGSINIKNGNSILFVPRLPPSYGIWMGHVHTLDDFKNMYEVDEVHYSDEIDKYFSKVNPSLLLTLSGQNSDSGLVIAPATFPGIEKYVVNCDILYPIISECRVIKSPEEIEVLRYVAKVSSEAHKQVMKIMKPGMTEYQGESAFLHHCYSVGGCRIASYTCICASGHNSSTLHYGHANAPNDKAVKDGELCLFDMGANYAGYCADITCTFPANGKFTDDQKLIYNAVLAANLAVQNTVKDGVSWKDMHLFANKVMLEKLVEGNLLHGNVDDMLKAGMGEIFQPHGLGHLLGLDVHDVGGYLPGQPEKPTEPGVKSLRFARILKDGMYVTVEPGCYFIDYLMDKALADEKLSKFINREVFERFRGFGGVRIEDNIVIRKDGCDLLSIVPRTVEEIEKWISS